MSHWDADLRTALTAQWDTAEQRLCITGAPCWPLMPSKALAPPSCTLLNGPWTEDFRSKVGAHCDITNKWRLTTNLAHYSLATCQYLTCDSSFFSSLSSPWHQLIMTPHFKLYFLVAPLQPNSKFGVSFFLVLILSSPDEIFYLYVYILSIC